MNVKTLSMAGATWDEGQDHSKWAVSTSGAKPTVCIGGVNRMLSQRKRGGGTVCFARAWGSRAPRAPRSLPAASESSGARASLHTAPYSAALD